jgi:hypothetical protein
MNDIDAIAGIQEICRQERELIGAGKFDALVPLIARKQAIADDLVMADPESLSRLRDLLGRSQALTEAAIKGVKSARQRLHQIRNAGSAINSYDLTGKTRVIGDVGTTIERRF